MELGLAHLLAVLDNPVLLATLKSTMSTEIHAAGIELSAILENRIRKERRSFTGRENVKDQ